MRGPRVVGALVGLAVLPAVALAAPLDGSTPFLCAPSSVVECSRRGECERSTPEEADIPPFVRVDVTQRVLASVDGSRTSPIAAVVRNNGRLMIQGTQNERAWSVAIDERSGQMTATISEADGAIVVSGTCIAP